MRRLFLTLNLSFLILLLASCGDKDNSLLSPLDGEETKLNKEFMNTNSQVGPQNIPSTYQQNFTTIISQGRQLLAAPL